MTTMGEQVLDRRPTTRLSTDVVIVGGGAAGLAAACTAARRGLSVVLLERYGFCGGGAVAGMSGTVCGLYLASDNEGPPEKVCFGFVDEFIAEMEARNGLAPPTRYGRTYTRVHDPVIWRESADALLARAGIQVVYHCLVTQVITDGERIAGVVASTKAGRLEVRAQITIDASGDADVIAMADLPNTTALPGIAQNPTMIFRLQGVNVAKFLGEYGHDSIMPPAVTNAIVEAAAAGADLPRKKVWIFPTTRPGELLCNCTRVLGPDGEELNTLSSEGFTQAEFQGRSQARAYADFMIDNLAGCSRAFVSETGVQVGIRQTRQIVGLETLTNEMVIDGVKDADGIARSPWPIERHVGDSPKVNWLIDDFYEVPWGCLVPSQGKGILTAGRCLSATNEAQASARVTAQCFGYGQAAGTAAAIAIHDHIEPSTIAGRDIRAEMNVDGARLD